MTRILQIAKLAAFGALVFLLVALALLALRVERVVPKVSALVEQAEGAVSNLNAALATINRPCKAGDCGTLAGADLAIHEVLVTTGQIEIAARHEDARIGVLDGQEAQLAADTHASLAQLRRDLATANTTIAGLQPVETNLTNGVAEMQAATQHASALLANPDLQATLKNTSHASASLAAIADDTRQAVHGYFHPKWPKKVWNAVTGVGVTAMRIFF